MRAKITLEINREEKNILMDALENYEKYLVEIIGKQDLSGNVKIVYDDTLAKTKEMNKHIRL